MQRWKNKENTHFLKHYLHYLGTTGLGYFRLGEWKKKKSQSIKPQDFSYFFRLYQAVRTGLEPATPGVTGLYSNQLNYRTKLFRELLKSYLIDFGCKGTALF